MLVIDRCGTPGSPLGVHTDSFLTLLLSPAPPIMSAAPYCLPPLATTRARDHARGLPLVAAFTPTARFRNFSPLPYCHCHWSASNAHAGTRTCSHRAPHQKFRGSQLAATGEIAAQVHPPPPRRPSGAASGRLIAQAAVHDRQPGQLCTRFGGKPADCSHRASTRAGVLRAARSDLASSWYLGAPAGVAPPRHS